MSKDLQRPLLAGVLIAIILLLSQYFEFFGAPKPSPPIAAPEETLVVAEPLLPYVAPLLPDEGTKNPNTIIADIDPVETSVVIINTGVAKISLSSFSGGSFLSYVLTETTNDGRVKHLGAWSDNATYHENSNIDLILDNNSRGCAPCILLKTNNHVDTLKTNFIADDNFINNRTILLSKKKVFSFQHEISQTYTITKKVSFSPNSYASSHTVSIINHDGISRSVGLVWDKGIRNTEKNIADDLSQYTYAYIGKENGYEDLYFDTEKKRTPSLSVSGPVDWASIRNKYFTVAFVPSVPVDRGVLSASHYRQELHGSLVPVYSASIESLSQNLSTTIYCGPLDSDLMGELSYLNKTMNFGWFVINPVARGVLWVLKSLGPSGLGIPYGFVLILFAFAVRLITGPLTKRSHKSSLAMQKIQPELKKIQEKYKKEPQKLQKEMVKLYKEKGVNPLGGCLPMLIQMPLLFALFIVFRSTVELRGVSFLWIDNLALPDVFWEPSWLMNMWGLGFFYEYGVAFLPLVVGVTMILSQRINAATMDKKQKPMMYIMSVFFFLLFNKFSAGLNLYYAVYNILNYIQQRSIKKAQ